MTKKFSANRQDFPKAIPFLAIKVRFSYYACNSVFNILVQKEQDPEMQYKLMCHPLTPFPAVPERRWFLFSEMCSAGDVWGAVPSAVCLTGLMHLLSPARSRDQWSLRPSRLLPSTGHESFGDPPGLRLPTQHLGWEPSYSNHPSPCLFKCSKTKPRGGIVAKWQNLMQAGLSEGLMFCDFCNHCKAELCWVLARSQHKLLVQPGAELLFRTVYSSWNNGAVWCICIISLHGFVQARC